MSMTGHQFEHHVADVFRKLGWTARVTPGSGDYGVDVILSRSGDSGDTRVAVQVKMFSSPVGPKAVQEVAAGKAVHRCTEAWVVTNSTFTAAATRLAAANGVRLISGSELNAMASQSQPARPRTRSTEPAQRVVAVSWPTFIGGSIYLLALIGGMLQLFSGTLDGTGKLILALMVLSGIAWLAVRSARRRSTLRAARLPNPESPGQIT